MTFGSRCIKNSLDFALELITNHPEKREINITQGDRSSLGTIKKQQCQTALSALIS